MVRKIIFPEAQEHELISAGKDFFARDLLLEKNTYTAWLELKQAAIDDGISLFIVSGFISYEYQQKIIDRKLANGQT
ncbi:D-alanyl-D-alanine carboxypeptidase family protein, partial [Francisella tularensis subsp. holarctica]|uniref:D-alanyl-D-alanine carboxypeptidase family protein n=1 Tax=Francisella tularensis TaxID=263 RepID=UPI002381AA76